MPPKILRQYCEYALTVLNSQFQATKVITHTSTTGTIREQLIRDFLKAHLPELVTVLSGQIFDSENNYSKQQDIVLVMKSMPRLPFTSGNDLIFMDGVVATIEAKTRVDGEALKSIGENFASVRRLVPAPGASAQMGVNHKWPQGRVLTAVVTYGGMSLASVDDALKQMDPFHIPDLFLDLSKGMLVRNHGLLIPPQGEALYNHYEDAPEAFEAFLIFLTEITGTLAARGVSWRKYLDDGTETGPVGASCMDT